MKLRRKCEMGNRQENKKANFLPFTFIWYCKNEYCQSNLSVRKKVFKYLFISLCVATTLYVCGKMWCGNKQNFGLKKKMKSWNNDNDDVCALK